MSQRYIQNAPDNGRKKCPPTPRAKCRETQPGATNIKAGAANPRPGTKLRPAASNGRPGATTGKPTAANPKPAANPTPPGAANPRPTAAQLAIQTIEGAENAMSTARADVERAKLSKADQNKVFPRPARPSARALAHLGALNRKARPTKSLGDALNELLKQYKALIEEINRFSAAYHETKTPGSLKHLLNWESNKGDLKTFAERIARLRQDLIGVLSQQAVQHPGKHIDTLAQIESRLASNRVFYATIADANEDIAEAFSSKNRGGSGAPIDGALLKKLAGVVGGSLTQGIASAIKENAGTALKRFMTSGSKEKAKPVKTDPKPGGKKVGGTGGHPAPNSRPPTHPKQSHTGPSGHMPPSGQYSVPQQGVNYGNGYNLQTPYVQDQPYSYAAAPPGYQEYGWHRDSVPQQMEVNHGEGYNLQTPHVQGQPFPDTTAHPGYQEYGWYRDVAPSSDGNERYIAKDSGGVVDQPGYDGGQEEQEAGDYALGTGVYEYASEEPAWDGGEDGEPYLSEGEDAGGEQYEEEGEPYLEDAGGEQGEEEAFYPEGSEDAGTGYEQQEDDDGQEPYLQEGDDVGSEPGDDDGEELSYPQDVGGEDDGDGPSYEEDDDDDY
ncbi:hypothetical protein BC826DRAFT_1039151 [Russula brevipes]|nr:hypothetical protein BC826DRAFT_1039151 [Russula brevipes]